MPLRPRREYAADLPRGLPGSSCLPPREFPAHTLDGCAPLPAQIHQVSSRCRIKVPADTGRSGWADSWLRMGGHEVSGPMDMISPGHA